MSGQAAARQGKGARMAKHLKTLERRMLYLRDRIDRARRPEDSGFDQRELGMLHVLRELARLHLGIERADPAAASTSALLHRAAAELERHYPSLRAEELVLALRARARLLEALEEPDAEGDS